MERNRTRDGGRLFFGAEDYRGDIFSLGATIYELLAGSPPFGIAGEPEELLERRNRKEYPPLAKLSIGCPGELSTLVDRMLAYSPGDRPEYPEIIRVLRESAGKGDESGPGPGTETRAFFSRFLRRLGPKQQ